MKNCWSSPTGLVIKKLNVKPWQTIFFVRPKKIKINTRWTMLKRRKNNLRKPTNWKGFQRQRSRGNCPRKFKMRSKRKRKRLRWLARLELGSLKDFCAKDLGAQCPIVKKRKIHRCKRSISDDILCNQFFTVFDVFVR